MFQIQAVMVTEPATGMGVDLKVETQLHTITGKIPRIQ
jgi:hypothetical protein